MARSPNKKAEQARQLYEQGMKLIEIAAQLNVPPGTVRRWKSTYSWDEENQSERSLSYPNARKDNKQNIKSSKEPVAKEVTEVLQNTGLTEKQRLFCLYFVKSFNATKAYQKAYKCDYATAMANGSSLLRNTKVREQIQKLKEERMNREFLTEADIFQKYMDIAFADITDFIEFGQEDVPVMAMYGPVQIKDEKTGEKRPLMKKVNVMRFKDSFEVDGTLISEIKQGKNGTSIKLADRMKALDWISQHMNMATEEQKARIKLLNAQCGKLTEKDYDTPERQELIANIADILCQLQMIEEDDVIE